MVGMFGYSEFCGCDGYAECWDSGSPRSVCFVHSGIISGRQFSGNVGGLSGSVSNGYSGNRHSGCKSDEHVGRSGGYPRLALDALVVNPTDILALILTDTQMDVLGLYPVDTLADVQALARSDT